MAKLVSKTYGEALFQVAVEQGKLDSFIEEITAIQEILIKNPDLNALMNHPKLTKDEKKEVINNIFDTKIDKEILGFFDLVITKDRYQDVNSILMYFIEKAKLEKGIGTAKITSAVTLSEEQKQQILNKLLETTTYQKMDMTYCVDNSLIGGMVLRIGDRVVDSSIKTKLDNMQKELLTIRLTK